MDLMNLKPMPRIIEMLHPATKAPLGIKVELIAIGDESLKKLKRSIQDRRTQLVSRGKDFKAEDIDENRNNLLFGAIKSWDWGEHSFKGTKPELNRVTVNAVLDELYWFRDQLEEALADEAAFFPA